MVRVTCPECGREIGTRPRRARAAGAFVWHVARHLGGDGFPCPGSDQEIDPAAHPVERPPVLTWTAGDPEPPPGWEETIEAFLAGARGRGGRPFARTTRDAYRRDLGHLAELGVERGIESPFELTREVLADHHAIVCGVDQRVTAGMARRVAAVRRFVRWLRLRAPTLPSRDDLAAWYPSITAATVRPHAPLGSLDLRRVYKAIEASTYRVADLREAVVVVLMLLVGLRRSEVAALDVRDLVRAPTGETLLQVRGKGGTEARVPIPPRVLSYLRRYLRATDRTIDSTGPLVVSLRQPPDGERRGVTDKTVYRLACALFDRAGVVERRVSPHGLRRTFSLLCKAEGIPTPDLQALMRHSTEAVTVRYARTLDPVELMGSMPDLPGRRRR